MIIFKNTQHNNNMSIVKADLRKYLKKYADLTDDLEDAFQNIRTQHVAGAEDAKIEQKIRIMEQKLQRILTTESTKQKQIANLENRQILWEQRIPKTYLSYQQPEDEINKNEIDELAHRIGRVRLTIKIHLRQFVHLKYNLLPLQSFERINQFNPKLPNKMKLVFFIFGERISTNFIQLEGKKIVNSDFKKLRLSKIESIQTIINFDCSRLSEVQKRFLESEMQIICMDEFGFVLMEGKTKAYNLITKQQLQIGLKYFKGGKVAILKLFIQIEEQRIVKQSQERYHIVNDRVLNVPTDMANQIQFEIVSEERDSPIKRNQYLSKQAYNSIDLKIVQRFRDRVKVTKNKQFLEKKMSQKIIQVFCNQPEMIAFPIQNPANKPKIVKLQYSKEGNTYQGQSQIRFITSQQLLKQEANNNTIVTNMKYSPFKQLKIKDIIILQIPPQSTITILICVAFSLAGEVKYSIVDQIYTFVVTDYQRVHYGQLKKFLTKDYKHVQNQLTIHYGIKLQFQNIQIREDSIKAVRGLWQKLLIPIHKIESFQKIHFRVFPYENDLKYNFLKQNCEIWLRCFSIQPIQTITVMMLNQQNPIQLIFIRIELVDRKAQSEKILKVKPNKKVYELDITNFTEENLNYSLKSMKPNFLKILSENVKFVEEDKRRCVIIEIQKIFNLMEIQIIIYDEKNNIGIPVKIIMIIDQSK